MLGTSCFLNAWHVAVGSFNSATNFPPKTLLYGGRVVNTNALSYEVAFFTFVGIPLEKNSTVKTSICPSLLRSTLAGMKNGKLLFIVVAAILFSGLVAGVFVLVRSGVVSPEVGLLMLIALLGLYVGFGVLILAYRLIMKLG